MLIKMGKFHLMNLLLLLLIWKRLSVMNKLKKYLIKLILIKIKKLVKMNFDFYFKIMFYQNKHMNKKYEILIKIKMVNQILLNLKK